jgi:copper chaperone CopZ
MSEGGLILNVYGMDCQGCVNNVRNAFMSVRGVREVEVRLEDRRVKVRFDPKQTDERKLKRAITKAGYLAGEA